jgi:squalene cyclase
MLNIVKSVGFIDEKGTNLEKARIDCILHGTTPPPDVVQGLYKLQNKDGGFPFGMVQGNQSTINETTVALWWIEELDLLTSPNATQAFAYLLTTQREDGSWDEDPRLAQEILPSWIQVGDLKTRLYLSAYSTYWLAVGKHQSLPAFRKAIHFLLRHQDQTGKIYGYLHNTWIATGVFLLAGDHYTKVANLGIQALAQTPVAKWDDNQIAWALDCLSTGGLPKTHPFIEGCLDELYSRQRSDGSWASENGEAFAVGATLQVLKVLKRYSLLLIDWDGLSA